MSAPESRFVEDIKVSNPSLISGNDVEQGSPPTYPLHETEQLVLGGSQQRCRGWGYFGRFRRCNRHAEGTGERPRRRCRVLRVLAWLFSAWVVLSLGHLIVTGIMFHKSYKTLKCAEITPANATDGLDFTLPLGHCSSRVFVHDSLSGGDYHVTHDSSIADGTFQLSVKFSEGSEQNDLYDGCMAQFKRNTGVALIPRQRHGSRAKIASLSLRFPTSLTSPSVHFIGEGNKHLSDNKLRKVIRWWRKHQHKKLPSSTGTTE